MNTWVSYARQLVALVPGARKLRRVLRRPLSVVKGYARDRGAPSLDKMRAARIAYASSAVTDERDTFVLYRIIGNDLHPRHRLGQSRENLEFILEHEPPLEGCEKRFIVNRIVDPEEESRITAMLEAASVPYERIPFVSETYKQVPWDVEGVPPEFAPWAEGFALLDDVRRARIQMRLYRHKNNYVMNNNGARNFALRDGRGRAKWVLPWDGNCFLTAQAWGELRRAVMETPDVPYWVVPMARITNNEQLHDPGFRPEALEEPQLMFRRDALQEFDERWFYGRRPKVELLWRLGVPGDWDGWTFEPWDLPPPAHAEDAGAFSSAGWVCRLFSGQQHLETRDAKNSALRDRGLARAEAVIATIDSVDARFVEALDFRRPVFAMPLRGNAEKDRTAPLLARLRDEAESALQRGPYSVVDKQTVPPSGDMHDYWHPAPYYWPNPIPGLPYIRRDGKRVPGTLMYEPLSERYDRTRLQRLFDDTWILALASGAFQDKRYAAHAVVLVRHWFIDPRSRMNPHLRFAQVRQGHNGNEGSSSGIIEMKDLYYFLDALRLLRQQGVLEAQDHVALESWFREYLDWLLGSVQGVRERAARNNHGTCFDLQVASIAAWLGDGMLLRSTLRDSRSRIIQQFAADGSQPEELSRETTAHYCCFNLQCWMNLAGLGERYGEDLWSFRGPDGQSFERALQWLVAYSGKAWPYRQIEPFDSERFLPLQYVLAHRFGGLAAAEQLPPIEAIKPLFHPHDGIPPFWQLCHPFLAGTE